VVKLMRFFLISTCLLGALILLPAGQTFAENERYKAIPMASGGFVFILDTREGHAWTWTNAGTGQVSKTGENPRFTYQGNVKKNMHPPKKTGSGPEMHKPQTERF